MARRVTLLSPVIGNGTSASPYRPQFSNDYPALQYSDITGRDTEDQPGQPNLVTIEATVDDPEPIYNNADYFVLAEVEIEEEQAT